MNLKKIDVYSHFSFASLLDFLEEAGGQRPHIFRNLFLNNPNLVNVDQRLRFMDRHGVEMHVLVPLPWLEAAPVVYADPKLAAQAARLCNDELAKVVGQHPDRFLGVALLPTTSPEIMIAEFEYAVKALGFAGGFIVVGPTVKRPDHPDYEFLYQQAVEFDVPIWIHPSRPATYSDYADEKMSMYQVWQAFGWILDSSTAMVRLVFNGVFQRYPGLKLIIHHHGAMVPLFAKRLVEGCNYFECASGATFDTPISKPYIDHFRDFYCDTATQGFEPLLLQIAYLFFGPDRLLFGTDAPMDSQSGEVFGLEGDKSVDALQIPEEDRFKIYSGNARKLLKLSY
jgi:predicted TIM-barrel fold metal-dependent hydrolase